MRVTCRAAKIAAASIVCIGVAGAPDTSNAQDADLALVLAVDISYSVGPLELDLQRRGYVEAFRTKEVIDAVTGGLLGRIAVTYLEWGGPGTQSQILPWSIIDGEASALEFARALETATLNRSDETSVSAALRDAMALFSDAPPATRRVIDLSADGYNNSGGSVTEARDQVVRAGVTINGLPVLTAEAPDLDLYFRDCVVGGPGAIVHAVSRPADFSAALRRKLVSEIAGASPERIFRAAMTDCRIGERNARREYLRQLDSLTNGNSERWRPNEENWPEPE
jgi:hypothetical protein